MYDIRDNKPYTVRKLADGNCWMTDNLALELTAGTPVEGSLNTSATAYTFTPTSCSTNGACAMNGNTLTPAPNGNYYYSWYAATAGTGTSSQTSTDSSASICPTGWRLPANYTISSSRSYSSLTDAYGTTTNGDNNTNTNTSIFESVPLSFVRNGNYYSGSSYYYDVYGFYYYSTASFNTTGSYYFGYGASRTYPQDYDISGKSPGQNIRCVAL